MTSFENPAISVDSDGLHVLSEEVAEKLGKKNLSPSLVTGLEKCPASWLADSFVIRDLVQEEPDNAANRGTLFHRIMELFFAVEPQDRTMDLLKELTNSTLAEEQFAALAASPEARKWLKGAIEGYISMGAKPKQVQIATIKDQKGRDVQGLEVFVKRRFEGCNRDILGFIDRLAKDPRVEDGLIIEDWKTGGKAKRWNPKTKDDDGKAEARQQVIYKLILEAEGYNVTGARLIFPAALNKKTGEPEPTVVNVDLKDKDFEAMVVKDVQEADKKLDVMIENNSFEYRPQFLCSWCNLAKICPAADLSGARRVEKARVAYEKLPEAEVLVEGFELQ